MKVKPTSQHHILIDKTYLTDTSEWKQEKLHTLKAQLEPGNIITVADSINATQELVDSLKSHITDGIALPEIQTNNKVSINIKGNSIRCLIPAYDDAEVLPVALLAMACSYLPVEELFRVQPQFVVRPVTFLTEACFNQQKDLDAYASKLISDAIDKDDVLTFPDALRPIAHKIQKLDLENSDATKDDIKILVELLPNLKGIYLDGCRSIDDEVVGILSQCSKLVAIDLTNTPITEKALDMLPPSIEELNLSSNHQLRGECFTKLALLVHLKKLDLGATDISDQELDTIISSLPLLEELDLSSNEQLSDAIFSKLASVTHLKKLSLHCNRITDQALDALPSSLVELDLSHCEDLTEAAFAKVARLSHLEILDMSGIAISDEAWAALATKQNLKSLNITVTRDATKKLLEESLPNASIYCDTHELYD